MVPSGKGAEARGSSGARLARGAALAAVVLALGLAGLELWLRARRPKPPPAPAEERAQWDGWRGTTHRASSVPGLVYELVPGLDRTVYDWRVRTNSLGMRDDEPREGPDVLRIAAIGDSFTFGFGVTQGATWTHLLERALDGSQAVGGRRVDVLDLGVSGYSTRDEVVVLERRALPLEPRLVILQYCVNDPETRPIQPLHRYFSGEPWWRSSALLTGLVERLQQREYGRAGGYYAWLHDPAGEPWRSVTEGFARFREACVERGIPVVLVVFPILRPRPWSEYPHRAEHAQVLAEGERNGFVTLDLLEVFEEVPPAELMLAEDDVHPNPRGHRLAAEALRSLLAERGLLEAAATER